MAIASVVGAAFATGAKKQLERYVAEPISELACLVTDSVAWNPSPNSFTVLVARFQNDKDRSVQNSVTDLLRRSYALNILDSCRQVTFSSAGNPSAVADTARKSVNALLSSKQADLVVSGIVQGDGIIDIASDYPGVVRYLLDPDTAWSNHIEKKKLDQHFKSIEFRRTLLYAANDSEARFKSCSNPLYTLCDITNLPSVVEWTRSLIHIYDDQALAPLMLLYDPIAKEEYARLLGRTARNAYFAKVRDPKKRTPGNELDYWFLARYYIDQSFEAFKYNAPTANDPEGTAVKALIFRATAEGCLDVDLDLAKLHAEDARKLLYGGRDHVKNAEYLDSFRKFLYDLELLRVLFLEYSAGMFQADQVRSLVNDIISDWDNRRPAFIGIELQIELKMNLDESRAFLKRYNDTYDYIKANVANPPNREAYARLRTFDSRYCS